MGLARKKFELIGAVLSLALLAGCTIQLAPSYDAGIVTGLNAANTQAQTMFATVSSGVTKDTYSAREAQYNAMIGQFSALDAQIAARPMPQPPSWFANHVLPSSDVNQIPRLNAPSKAALDHIVVTLTMMRDTDAAAGLAAAPSCPASSSPTCGFKQDYMQNFDSALTYESALQR
ncbi:MAG TPA: hypothetical protein VG889_00675 [Rhizomicrobium sp.]|nr:hypothetical protein [Rhizomicrobium sp.]